MSTVWLYCKLGQCVLERCFLKTSPSGGPEWTTEEPQSILKKLNGEWESKRSRVVLYAIVRSHTLTPDWVYVCEAKWHRCWLWQTPGVLTVLMRANPGWQGVLLLNRPPDSPSWGFLAAVVAEDESIYCRRESSQFITHQTLVSSIIVLYLLFLEN